MSTLKQRQILVEEIKHINTVIKGLSKSLLVVEDLYFINDVNTNSKYFKNKYYLWTPDKFWESLNVLKKHFVPVDKMSIKEYIATLRIVKSRLEPMSKVYLGNAELELFAKFDLKTHFSIIIAEIAGSKIEKELKSRLVTLFRRLSKAHGKWGIKEEDDLLYKCFADILLDKKPDIGFNEQDVIVIGKRKKYINPEVYKLKGMGELAIVNLRLILQKLAKNVEC